MLQVIRIPRPSLKRCIILLLFGIMFWLVFWQQHILNDKLTEINAMQKNMDDENPMLKAPIHVELDNSIEEIILEKKEPNLHKGRPSVADRIKDLGGSHEELIHRIVPKPKEIENKEVSVSPKKRAAVEYDEVDLGQKWTKIIIPEKREAGNLMFLHVAKSAGTALSDYLTHNVALTKRMTPIADLLTGYVLVNKDVHSKHFDWTVVDQQKIKYPAATIDVLTLLRNPVDRAVSHFNFVKREKGWAKNLLIDVTIEDFLSNHALMMEIRGVWQDGQGSVSWLTGTHIGSSWVLHDPVRFDKDKIEWDSLDFQKMMILAADRLESTFWFGLKEKLEESIEMIHYQLPNSKRPKQGMRDGINKLSYDVASNLTRKKLESLMPMDVWLYKYAERLFNSRYQYFKTEVLIIPERPPFLDISCRSTRFILMCNQGPYAPLLFKWENQLEKTAKVSLANQEKHYELFRNILYK